MLGRWFLYYGHFVFAVFSREDAESGGFVSARAHRFPNLSGKFASVSLIVAAAKVLLEPDVEANEKVAAAHFLDFELGSASAAITPSDGNYCPGVTPHDCF